MIVYINDRLNAWAEWCARGRRVVGLGYPGKVAFYRLAPIPGTASAPIPDEACWEIEQAVRRLDVKHKAVVDQFYLRAGTAETHAKALHCCQKTMYLHLHQAHVKIMEWLQVGDDEDFEQNRLTALHGFCKKAAN